MKTNMVRIFCIVLVFLMAVSCFTACKKDTSETPTNTPVTATDNPVVSNVVIEPSANDPFSITKDTKGKDIVILTPSEDGTVVMTVAEKTTLKDFLAVVTAKKGFTIKISDAKGKEVTDAKTIIAKNMVFEVFADGATTAEVKYIIDVVSEKKIQEAVKKQQAIQQHSSAVASGNNNSSRTSSNQPSNSSTISSSSSDSGSSTASIKIAMSTTAPSIYTGSDAMDKAWQHTLTTMKTKKGISTDIYTLDPNNTADIVVKEVMAGKASADVYDVPLVTCRFIAKKKAAANIFESKTLDRSLYNTAVTESVTFGGKAYGVSFAAKSVNPMGVLYNKELLKKYAPKYDIAELYRTKKWTFETFEEIAKLCTVDTDGNGKTDIFGFTSNTNIIGMALTANAGGTALMKNGRVEATMCNDAGIAALEWCKKMYKNDKTWNYKSDIYACADTFINGESAMFVSYLMYYPHIAAKANFDFGYVLMPIGPDQSEYKNGVYDGSVYVVPKTKESRLNDIGLWLNNIASVSSKLINLYIQEMARNGLDSTSQNIYKWLVNNMSAEYSTGAFTGAVSSVVDNSVTSPTSSPAKVMASIKSQAQKECDDFYAELY